MSLATPQKKGSRSAPSPRRLLNPKQSKFVEAYMTNGGNAADAYRQATGKTKNAKELAYALKRNPAVARLLSERLAQYDLDLNLAAQNVKACLDAEPVAPPTWADKMRAASMVVQVHQDEQQQATTQERVASRFEGMPAPVIFFIARTGRMPSPEEQARLLASNADGSASSTTDVVSDAKSSEGNGLQD